MSAKWRCPPNEESDIGGFTVLYFKGYMNDFSTKTEMLLFE